MVYQLMRPGVQLIGEGGVNCPRYPFRFEKPKAGDTVWVIVEDDETHDMAIDTDTISEVSDFHEEAVRQYAWRKAVLAGEVEWPEYEGERLDIRQGDLPDPAENYSRDYWLTKYGNGHGNDFGETMYQSFAEALSVFVQYFCSDHELYLSVLNSTEEDLKPKPDGGHLDTF